ncbi:S-adenosylmethionine decarboxylase [Salibacteraceae bacterium]|jgi:S-adenosylmethionine decarboxylase|nr:S-adenosylmethionine decarboxylase [Salibacteraceae bacterium]
MEEAQIYNHREWLPITNSAVLVERLSKMLEQSGYTVLNFVEHHFEPQGYTSLWLLSESHLALHTFPENEKSYVELSGCRKEMNEDFVRLMNAWLEELHGSIDPSVSIA